MFCNSMFDVKKLSRSPGLPFSFVVSNTLLFLDHFHSLLEASFHSIPQFLNLQHCGVSKAIQASSSQFHLVASLGLQEGTHFTHT